jgi:pantothenate kinase
LGDPFRIPMMETIYQHLAAHTVAKLETLNSKSPGSRLLIAVAGPPGLGKTTSTKAIAALINIKDPSTPVAAVVSMDGYHHPRSYLDALPNREEAYRRRGAPWTFDSAAIVELARCLRGNDGDIYAPTFDHATKDPVVNGLLIPASIQIVLLEGNYLLVNEQPWSLIKGIVDECWLVTVDPEEARQRVARRHVAAGIEPDMESALKRVDGNDTLNGVYIMEKSREAADVVIESIPC